MVTSLNNSPASSQSSSLSKELVSRARASFLGLVIGDVLGAPVQFGSSSTAIREHIDRLKDYHDNQVLRKGVYTDDTSMALCLADSLIEKKGYDSYDIMKKFSDWESFGYRSYFDYGYDVGIQVDNAISDFDNNPIVLSSKEREWNAGNGSIMRLAPVIIAAAGTQSLADSVRLAWLSGRETHYSEVAEMSTEVFANFLFRALHQHQSQKSSSQIASSHSKSKESTAVSPEELIKSTFDDLYFTSDTLKEAWLDNSWQVMPRINSDGECLRDLGGYIIDAITIALWGLVHSKTFEDGMLKVLSLGGDTDTNCAIYGQLAGAFYGLENIPTRWTKDLAISSEAIFSLTDELLNLPGCPILRTRFEEDTDYFKRPD
ncbi:ADP-ribosylglycohydrolase family protein [Candidatus Saccharibacteria bacterium]|nr:ADP-ribosylglycohydrolase family protein [Candidatus Saccharibacteria bacterium]